MNIPNIKIIDCFKDNKGNEWKFTRINNMYVFYMNNVIRTDLITYKKQ